MGHGVGGKGERIWSGGEEKARQRRKERKRRSRGKQRSPETGSAIKDKAELATLGLRKNFKRVVTEAKTTTMDTFHTRTVFQRSATPEERHCFLSLALPQCGLLTWSVANSAG